MESRNPRRLPRQQQRIRYPGGLQELLSTDPGADGVHLAQNIAGPEKWLDWDQQKRLSVRPSRARGLGRRTRWARLSSCTTGYDAPQEPHLQDI